MEKIFAEKVVIVTGGSFGIGKASAIAFAQRGAKVVVADCVEDKDTVDTITKFGGKAIFIKCDVSNSADVKLMVDKTIEKFGRLDYALNNAGIEGIVGNTVDCTEENWDNTVNVNLKGIWLCMKYEIPEMIKCGKGAIVNIRSVDGLVGFQTLPAYVASKHGVVGLTKTTALEFAKQDIRINAVCPGTIKTTMLERFTGNKKEIEQQYANMEPIGRLGMPEEVAEAVIWLCSDASSYVTGHAMLVDGGWVA